MDVGKLFSRSCVVTSAEYTMTVGEKPAHKGYLKTDGTTEDGPEIDGHTIWHLDAYREDWFDVEPQNFW